jgi:hypothetical protein
MCADENTQIDGTAERNLLSRFGVMAFPSMFLLEGGYAWEYDGQRSVPAVRPQSSWGSFPVSTGLLLYYNLQKRHIISLPRCPRSPPVQLKEFVLGGYQKFEPLPYHKRPNTVLGLIFGKIYR